ncbi:hypothetical protein [Streptomyces sp. NPDC020747]|uniref:hypothetical protein n=1 Tax=Streptomyces sp. NPDC020747 TaxID=3365086 RepID=UPI0037AE40C8
MSGIRREHVRVLNVDDETGHTEPRAAAGAGVVNEVVAEVTTAAGGRPCRMADGASEARVARSGIGYSGIARGGVPHADVLDGTRHDTDRPEHRTDGLAPASAIHAGRGAGYVGSPTEDGR